MPAVEPATVLPAREVALVEVMDIAVVPAVVPLLEAALVVMAVVVGERRRHGTKCHRGRRQKAQGTCEHAYLQ
jgi:hypothetical protein